MLLINPFLFLFCIIQNIYKKLKNSKVFFFASVSLIDYLFFKRYRCCLNFFEDHLKSHMNLLLSVGMIFILQNLTFTVVHSFKNTTQFQLVLLTKKCILSQDLIKGINFY